MFDTDKIDGYFPLQKYRAGQKRAIQKVLEGWNEGHKYVMLEAPTGSGKSAIGMTIMQMIDNSFYIAPQKFLQDQLMVDFGDEGRHTRRLSPMIDLKGRNAYPCDYWERALQDPSYEFPPGEEGRKQRQRYKTLADEKNGCDTGQCKRDGDSKCEYCVAPDGSYNHCAYFKRVRRAQSAKICLMNFHSFLFQTSFSRAFGHRKLLIIDEAHNTEDVLLKFVELKLSDKNFQSMGIRFEQLDTVEEYIAYFEEIALAEKIAQKISVARLELNTKEEEEWKNQLLRLSILASADPKEWVCSWEETVSGAFRTVTLKPIYVGKFAQKYIFSKADHILLMSATILSSSTMCESLGIQEKVKFIRMMSNFPKENRPIYFRPAGAMSYENKADTLPKMIEEIDHLCKFHQDERGIIHTHSFEILQAILDKCSPEVRKRLLHQRDAEFDGDKRLLLAKHMESPNSIIIAPAMHEGLDLKDDLGRFQIICKVPYPSMNDVQIAARMEISHDYFNWRAATKLCQSYGRIYRHEDDHGVTYILDSDFRRFYQNTEYMLPAWFKDAIHDLK